MIDELRTHISGKLSGRPLDYSPFPHVIIEDFFPADIYRSIQSFNLFQQNAGKEWLDKKASAGVTGRTPYHARKQINFHLNDVFEASDEARTFWSGLTTALMQDDWFARQVFANYPEYFRLRFGDLVDAPDFFELFREELFLQRHEPGYNIGPHTDIPTRVFTCIFSFAESDGYDEFGTELLVHRDRLARCWGCDHYATDDFSVAKVAPYRPNNFLLFFKTRHSFHSVKTVDASVPNQRYGMQFQFYEPAGGLFDDLSRPDLMKTLRMVPPAAPKGRVRRLLEKAGMGR